MRFSNYTFRELVRLKHHFYACLKAAKSLLWLHHVILSDYLFEHSFLPTV